MARKQSAKQNRATRDANRAMAVDCARQAWTEQATVNLAWSQAPKDAKRYFGRMDKLRATFAESESFARDAGHDNPEVYGLRAHLQAKRARYKLHRDMGRMLHAVWLYRVARFGSPDGFGPEPIVPALARSSNCRVWTLTAR